MNEQKKGIFSRLRGFLLGGLIVGPICWFVGEGVELQDIQEHYFLTPKDGRGTAGLGAKHHLNEIEPAQSHQQPAPSNLSGKQ